MKLFLEKTTSSNNQSIFKVHQMTDDGYRYENDIDDSMNVIFGNNNNQLIDIDSLQKKYLIETINNTSDINMIMPFAHIKDSEQYGDYNFALTENSYDSPRYLLYKNNFYGKYCDAIQKTITYNIVNTPNVDATDLKDIEAEMENLFGRSDPFTYDVSGNITGQISEDERLFIGNVVSGLYDEASSILPFNYMFEIQTSKVSFDTPNSTVESNFNMFKNHLSHNGTSLVKDGSPIQYVLWRKYESIGTNSDTIWASYSYDIRDVSNNKYSALEGYETVDQINSFNKYKTEHGKKSNIFSIRIKNSGLGNVPGEIGTSIRGIFEKAIFNIVSNAAPAHTQLWKIEYVENE
jgi:hypothetical protein